MVELPPGVAAKVLLLNEMPAQKIKQTDPARKLSVPISGIARIRGAW